jgi:uncharacterized protein
VEIEFDPAKSERNVRERGLSFELTADFDFETAVYVEDNRYNYGERRIRALGYIEERLYALVYTVRGETLRVISLRRANRREVKIYEDATRS